MEFWRVPMPDERIRFVGSVESKEFGEFLSALECAYIIALDAEWKPVSSAGTRPRVSLLQVACRFMDSDDLVFLVDVLKVAASELVQPLKQAFTSHKLLKLGFKLRQDLINLAASLSLTDTFFCEVEPYIDIGKLHRQVRRVHHNGYSGQTASLSNICGEVLGLPLCKELQCSDWELRPLTKEQIAYAAADAHCLLAILDALQPDLIEMQRLKADISVGIAQLLYPETQFRSLLTRFRKQGQVKCLEMSYLERFQEVLTLEAEVTKRKTRTRKMRDRVTSTSRLEWSDDTHWCGPPPWDPAVGGDGCPKFLCDIMIEGLARQLRCVGIDAACPHGLKPDARQLVELAQKEGRVLLTRDAKLLRQRLIPSNQAYRVKQLSKKDQLAEIIETFQLSISEEQLLSRCAKCNGELFPQPMTAEEARLAVPNQEIPSEVYSQDGLLFWQCSECRHLYWQGLQFQRAMKQFATMCN